VRAELGGARGLGPRRRGIEPHADDDHRTVADDGGDRPCDVRTFTR
jgi:hypothetical protein